MFLHLNPFYNKSIRRLRQMIHAIRMRDFTLHFALDKLRGEERLLAEEINAVVNEFREKTLNRNRNTNISTHCSIPWATAS